MDREEARKRIEALRDELNHHAYLYYVLDSPVVEDDVYDSLIKELVHLDRKSVV